MASEFVARAAFPVLNNISRSYFLGHHKAGLDKMKQMIQNVDLIIECRDYRVPLSSTNPMFEQSLAGRERLVVFTKRDLGKGNDGARAEPIMKKWLEPSHVLFSDHKSPGTTKKIIEYTRKSARITDSLVGSRMLIVGMPNVGKSSLLNALRREGVGKGKAAITGGQPGITRKIGTTVKISDDPLIYLLDTPGVFIPYVPNVETMLKLALVGCVKDTVIPLTTLADYLLYRLNLYDPTIYSKYSPPTNDILELLTCMAKATGRLAKGGVPELEGTAMWLLGRYRAGEMGKFILDDVSKDAYENWKKAESEAEPSASALRREAKRERLRISKAKYESKNSASVE